MTRGLDPAQWQRISELLDAALECRPEDRARMLNAECVDAPNIRREVEDLLSRVDEARRFLESPPSAVAAAVMAEARGGTDIETGRRIGAYRIEREIGRGGMSRVFLARRADGQFEQHVAVKLLLPGLDTEIDRARFRAERQILASLNHPHIARLIDGGLTEWGQLYLVLEYVEGVPIDVYCETHSLSVRERLELFLDAADATQYAHRNLVVHRDLKSSNVLVSGAGEAKLLDFGLAKLLEPSAYGRELSGTLTVANWMTPEYAAPEQIRRDPVTTLTDVYQLGAMLYRILSGRLPFIAPDGGLRELEALVLRGDPAPPSDVVADADPVRAKLLRGDLDAIVLKALHKEPGERFASVDALADDLRRHLSGHPVLARRNTAVYRARRFVRRHRVETFAVLGISLSVVVGAGFSFSQARRASVERDLAASASRESQAVTSFLLGLFEASDPAEARGDTLTGEQLVQRAAARAERLEAQPLMQARMLEVTGRLYESLGRYDDAYAMVDRALLVRRSAPVKDAALETATLDQLSGALLRLGKYAAADSVAREALRLEETALGPEHPRVAVTLHQLGSIAVFRGNLAASESYHRRALAVREAALESSDTLVAQSHLTLGAILRREGRTADAEREFRRGLALLEGEVGPDDPQLANAILQIAYLLDEDHARYADAEPLYRRALAIRRRAFGDGHHMVAATLFDLADFLSRRGDVLAAVAPARQSWEIVRRAYGGEHPMLADYTSDLATILYRAGDLDEAEKLFRQAVAIDRRVRGPDHENIAGVESGLARLLIDRGAYASADSVIHDALRIRRNGGGVNHPNTASTEGLLGRLLTRERRYAEADSVLRHSLATMQRQVGREHRDVRELYGWLADLQDARGRHAAADEYRALASAR